MKAKNPKSARHIISVAAFSRDEWYQIFDYLLELEEMCSYKFGYVELNISCPNKGTESITSDIFKHFAKWDPIIKLTPNNNVIEQIKNYLEWGGNSFHLSNTLPSAKGGISGPQLQSHSLRLIEKVRKIYGDTPRIIGGGGIYSKADIKRYEIAGVDHYSISTACFNPIKLFEIINYFKH